MKTPIDAFWVIYDDSCGFCVSCAEWLQHQESFIPLMCLPRSGDTTLKYFKPLLEKEEELIVIDSNGGVYRGPDAFLISLWALRRFRTWANWASTSSIRPHARAFFLWLGKSRFTFSRLLGLNSEAKLKFVHENVMRVAQSSHAIGCEARHNART